MGTFAKYDPVELEIRKTWQELRNENDAFAAFAEADLTTDDIEPILGQELGDRYVAYMNATKGYTPKQYRRDMRICKWCSVTMAVVIVGLIIIVREI